MLMGLRLAAQKGRRSSATDACSIIHVAYSTNYLNRNTITNFTYNIIGFMLFKTFTPWHYAYLHYYINIV